MKKIRVLIIDDSSVVCSMLSRELSVYRGISATGIPGNLYSAHDKIIEGGFDVFLLDMDMQKTNGLALLKSIMKLTFVRVIIMSSLVTPGNPAVVQALEAGAVDVAYKPGGSFHVEETVNELYRKILEASVVPVRKLCKAVRRLNEICRNRRAVEHVKIQNSTAGSRLVVIGTSTGGVLTLEELFTGFPAVFPPVLVVTHMSPSFTASFARRLDRLYDFHVKEAEDGEKPVQGTVYLSPGWSSIFVAGSADGTIIRIKNRYGFADEDCHIADMLFISAAETAGRNCTAVLLTGTGGDGAAGMKAVRDAGGWTIVQDRKSCIVYDMPGKAAALDAVCETVPLDEIAERIEEKTTSG
jgi:two-component system, chemotaxis family, protein-glutamate methylesterase/glutaminase